VGIFDSHFAIYHSQKLVVAVSEAGGCLCYISAMEVARELESSKPQFEGIGLSKKFVVIAAVVGVIR